MTARARKPGDLIQGYFCPVPAPRALQKRLASGSYRYAGGDLERRCSTCKDYWPADTEFFHTAVGDASGLHCYCRACYEEWRYPAGRLPVTAEHSSALAKPELSQAT